MIKVVIAGGIGALLLFGALLALPILGGGAALGVLNASASNCATSAPVSGTVSAGGLDTEQKQNAAVIIGLVQARKLPIQAALVAITAALDESSLHNLNHGDRDSLGLFQQRPSQGWGTPQQIMDPVYATGKFLDHLVNVPNWQSLPIHEAAQAVQNSGTKDGSNYARFEAQAQAIVASFVPSAGVTPTVSMCVPTTGSQQGLIAGALPKGPIAAPGKVIATNLPLMPLFPNVPPGGFPNGSYPWGQCTWFAAYEHNVGPFMGDGGSWIPSGAAKYGLQVTNVPTVGSVVSYRGGGAYSSVGHVAIVVAVPGDGTMVVEESHYVALGVIDQRVDPLNDPDIQGFIVG